jgi:three-Cys-motif partner protein
MANGSGNESKSSLPKGLSADDYDIDETDEMLRELVGPWVAHKHELLRRYVEISGTGVRKKWLQKANTAGATYIDLYCGTGRARVRETDLATEGGPLVAWRQSVASKSGFTQVIVADAHATIAEAAGKRLEAAGAPVHIEVGDASVTIDRVLLRLNPYALHFAFLDPYSLGALPFDVIRKLAKLERMDILIHVSVQDLNRNLRKYAKKSASQLDTFAPGWREFVGDLDRPDHYVRARIFEHWRNLLKSVGIQTTEVAESVVAENNQPLYWLAFAARHPRALDFWEKIRELEPHPQANLL